MLPIQDIISILCTVSRLPERGRCDCRDQCPGHQPVSDLPLDRLWTEASHPPGSPTSLFGGMQTPHQGGLIRSVCTSPEHLPCECGLLAGQ